MIVLHDDASCRLVLREGDSRGAIIVFGSYTNRHGVIVGPAKIPLEEFYATVEPLGLDVYFASDKRLRWYQNCGLELCRRLNSSMEERRTMFSIAVGASMGGFAAIAMARGLANRFGYCREVIAFGPQSSIAPSVVPWDRRFIEDWNRVEQPAEFPDAEDFMTEDIHYHIVVGDDELDRRHAERLQDTGYDVSVARIAGAPHSVASTLKERGELRNMIAAAIA